MLGKNRAGFGIELRRKRSCGEDRKGQLWAQRS